MRYIFKNDLGNLINIPSFIFQARQNEESADQLTLALNSELGGLEIKIDLIFTAALALYPTSTPAVFPLTLVYRECIPSDF